MVYKVVITYKAYLDILHILNWYDDHSIIAGQRFLDAVNTQIIKIEKQPSVYKTISPGIQRYLLKNFPYIIYFTLQPEGIVILRFRHKKQKTLKRFR